MTDSSLREMATPLLDGLAALEAEQREHEETAQRKAEEAKRARRSLTVLGVLQPKKRERKRKPAPRRAGAETIERAQVVIRNFEGEPWTTNQLADQLGTSIHTAYAVVEQLRAAKVIRCLGRKQATPESTAKARFYKER